MVCTIVKLVFKDNSDIWNGIELVHVEYDVGSDHNFNVGDERTWVLRQSRWSATL